MSERPRRQPVVSATRQGQKNALEALKAAREGGGARRVADFEVKKEAAVYDVLEEEDYVKLVAKRRHEGGDFIVNDDGQGYADLGEEDDHWRAAAEGSEDEGSQDYEENGGTKKRKGDGKGDRKAKKKGPGADKGDSAAGSGDIAKMFSKAAARAALNAPTRQPKAEVAVESSDAMLADILGGIGPADDLTPALGVSSGVAFGGVPTARIAPRAGMAAAAPSMLGRPAGAPARPQPAAPVRSAMPALAPPRSGSAVAARAPTSTHPAVSVPLVKREPQSAPPAAADQDVYMEDEPMEDAAPLADTHDYHDSEPAPADTTAADSVFEHASGAQAAAAAPEVVAVAADKGARKPLGVGAVVEERGHAVTSGWASMYTSEADAGEGADTGGAAVGTETAAPTTAAGSTTPPAGGGAPQASACAAVPVRLADGAVPFYFLDAYENMDTRTGEVFLFGKVPLASSTSSSSTSQWASACVVVPNCKRCVFVVPKSEVFADPDGTLAHLEGAAGGAKKDIVQLRTEVARLESDISRYSTPPLPPGVSESQAQSKVQEAQETLDMARGKLDAAEAAEKAAKMSLNKYLHELCGPLKAELRDLLTHQHIKNFNLKPVKRSYAFENPNVPRGEQWVIKVRYSATEPALSPALTGEHFIAVFGATTPCLEHLLIKRRLKGPCWTLLQQPTQVEYSNQVSWCKVELTLTSPKSLLCDPNHPEISNRPAPPVTVASLNLKTVIHPGSQQHEVVAAAVVNLVDFVDLEAPMSQDQWNRSQVLRNFCVVRKLDGQVWPPGFEAAAAQENRGRRGRLNGGNMLLLQNNERSLLTTLLAKLQALDADVLVGHNISAFDLHVLLTRMQHHKVPLWSRIGRLKRSTWPKLSGGGHAYGGGASAGTLSAVAGRVICDTYLSARELVREVDYTLRTLAASLLKEERGELTSADIPKCYQSTQGLMDLVRHAEGDAWLSLGLMFHLSVLPLTRALTALSGSLWTKTLQGARAQRIEMLLLHEFHARKFILPDKTAFRDSSSSTGAGAGGKGKGGKKGKGKSGGGGGAGGGAEAAEGGEGGPGDEDVVMLDADEGQDEEGAGAKASKAGGGKSGGKHPQYLGGLVLEPKKGLYDRLVIMLDFNSLYPSIIQEFNICFSTVQRPTDGSMPPLPASPAPGQALAPLPTILQNLVQRRRQAKSALASARDPVVRQQLNIRQQALKLTANSMYGCLGFTSSRFYAKPLAELITYQGRTILQSSVDLVQGTLGAEVIYGDTDSIMINTGSTDIQVARELGQRIKKEVNKRYKLLEIELDGIFKCMLLLKKKKYAAIKLEPGPNNMLVEVQEQKGLDIVRRDWCALSKDAGHHVLAAVLSCRPCEEVVEEIHEHLRSVREEVLAGRVPLNKFIITKQLTKRPEEYTDARSQPHVQVALRRRAAGKRDGVMPGEAVPYVICVERPAPGAPTTTTDPTAADPQQQAPGMLAAGTVPGSVGAVTPHPAHATGQAGASVVKGVAASTPVRPAIPPFAASSPMPANTPGSAVRGTPDAAALNTPTTAVKGGPHAGVSAGGGGLAERAYHPEELIESQGRLMLDTEYYLGQQVHPVVSRLVAVLQGTDAARLAECLGLDASRYRGAAGSGGGHYGGDQDVDVFGARALDDDALYQGCEPLTLTAPGPERTQFEFQGALEVVLGRMSPEQLLSPPDAVGDPARTLQGAQLANQVQLKARQFVSRYYDGWLDADDELAQAAHDPNNHHSNQQGGFRDVVLRPCGELERCPHPDLSRHAGVLLSRRITERQLYLQLCHFHRLLNPDLAVKRGLNQIKAKDPKTTVTEAELRARLAPIAPMLRAACDVVERLRAQSAYHWVDLTLLLAPVRQVIEARNTAAAAADAKGRQTPLAAAEGPATVQPSAA